MSIFGKGPFPGSRKNKILVTTESLRRFLGKLVNLFIVWIQEDCYIYIEESIDPETIEVCRVGR